MNRALPFLFLVLALCGAACARKRAPAVAQTMPTTTPEAAKPLASPSLEAKPQITQSPQQAAEDDDGIPDGMVVKDSAESRFGKLRVAAKENDYHHKLFFNGREISEYEGPIRLYEVFHGQDRDYVVGANDSGGIACPLAPFILEIYDREKFEIFEQFGDCRGDFNPKFIDEKVILEIPPYFPHPDLVPEKELKQAMKKMELYTWQKGKLLSQETRPFKR